MSLYRRIRNRLGYLAWLLRGKPMAHDRYVTRRMRLGWWLLGR